MALWVVVVDECNRRCFSFYQEFLGKTLTEKYTSLNTQMDKMIHNANSEISNLKFRLSGLFCHAHSSFLI